MDSIEMKLDYEAARAKVGIHLLSERLFVRVSGDDRVSFMHGMCTADVKNLADGSIARALFLTEHAHVMADCFIYALREPALWLEVEANRWPTIREHLERFLVADDVELDGLDTLGALDVNGPDSTELLAGIFGATVRELNPWQHTACDAFCLANLPRYGESAFTICGERSALLLLIKRIQQHRPGLPELQPETLETLRIENGMARVGVDTNERTLALEARLEPAIAFNKGCYIGQETVERATARGALKRRLCGLRIHDDEMPLPGAIVRLKDKEVGRVTSVTESPELGKIGLAILHHSAWPVGTTVSIDNSGTPITALISELPFRPFTANDRS